MVIATGLLFQFSQHRAISKELNCTPSDSGPAPYACIAQDGEEFEGVSIGQHAKKAFEKRLSSEKEATWSLLVRAPAGVKYTSLKRGINVDDWRLFASAERWILRSSGAPCRGEKYEVFHILKGRVSAIGVYCKILQK